MWGYSSEEVKGKSVFMLFPKKEIPKHRSKMKETITSKKILDFETIALTKSGGKVPVSIRGSAFFGKDGKVKGFVGVFRDITELKKGEQKLRISEKKLEKQKTALEQKNVALREIIEQINIEKNKIKKDIALNVENTLLPILSKLSLSEDSMKYRNLLAYHLNELASSFGHEISKRNYNLTLKEIEICNMIRGGLTNKEICKLIKISDQTVGKHRKNIRKKIGLTNKKINLASFLHKI